MMMVVLERKTGGHLLHGQTDIYTHRSLAPLILLSCDSDTWFFVTRWHRKHCKIPIQRWLAQWLVLESTHLTGSPCNRFGSCLLQNAIVWQPIQWNCAFSTNVSSCAMSSIGRPQVRFTSAFVTLSCYLIATHSTQTYINLYPIAEKMQYNCKIIVFYYLLA